jgi:glycine/D-amino acid oxidase-like deaminating enzyme
MRERPLGSLLIEERLEPSQITFERQGLSWRGGHYNQSLLRRLACRTTHVQLPPFKPAKGEMLTLRPRRPLDAFPQAIVNRGKWLLPVGDGLFRAGSTYSWDSFDDRPTDAGAREILEGLREFIEAEFDVVRQLAGVRPILKDYRPALGTHPHDQRVALFNGLGSKGVLAAPWLARQLMTHLTDGTPLREMDVRRFWK